MKMLVRVVAVLGLAAVLIRGAGAAAPEANDQAALAEATHALCRSRIAMLGESATHGDGHTERFKVALVERLVTECGFDRVVFEASHYEFLNIGRELRSGLTVSAEEISAAVGGLWRYDEDFQPLVPFLVESVRSGQLSLGGMDDQLGGMGQDFANKAMLQELAQLLPARRGTECGAALHRRVYGDFPAESPYSLADRAGIQTCLSDMQAAVVENRKSRPRDADDEQEMLSAVQRWVSRDFTPDAEMRTRRDQSMFWNFEWLLRQQPRRHKVLVWAATVHVAKRGDPTWGGGTDVNFGSLVHAKYGRRAVCLGFSALGGSYRQGRRDVQLIPAAPPGSVAALASRGQAAETIYVSHKELSQAGEAPGAFFRRTSACRGASFWTASSCLRRSGRP